MKAELSSKERVMMTLAHEEPDRIPVDFDCSQSDKVLNIMNYVGVKTKEELLRLFKIDLRWCVSWEDTTPVNEYQKAGTFVDSWGVERSYFGGYPVTFPMKDFHSIDELEAYPHWPDPKQMDYDSLKVEASKHQDFAVIGGFWSPFMETAQSLLGPEAFFIKLAMEPDFIHHLLDKILNFYLECNKILFNLCRNSIHIFHTGDDYGTQRGLLFSSEMFKEYVTPRQRKLFELGHSYGYLCMHHSCGSIRPVIPELIKIGLDALQPIQISATDMKPGELKKEFGGDLSFMGGVDAMNVLVNGTIEEVFEEVRTRIEELSGNGGYILSTTQGILPEIPEENIIAMYEAAQLYGVRGI